MKISVITPVYNEEKNIPILFEELNKVLSRMGHDYEIIAVDDGSKDKSREELKKQAAKSKKHKILFFQSNRGQTAALSAGIESATGDLIITIDSDLENDPNDIPRLIAKYHEGFDVVSGWRKNRWSGKFLQRKLPSVTANWLISRITRVHLHDYGCILKIYRRDIIQDVRLYGEMHRFIPAYAAWQGARVGELEVNYRPRQFGQTNYGFSRSFKVILDLVLIKFLHRYMNKPIHFFGGIGSIAFGVGFLAGLTAVYLKIVHLRDFVETPLPIFSALFIIVGVQLIVMGVIAEILMRTYYESQNKRVYSIGEKINF